MKTRRQKTKGVVLVTGGGTGIGRAIALEFAKKDFCVIVNYCHSKAAADRVIREAKDMGAQAVKIRADVTREAEVRAMFREIAKTVGRLDVLVNNAGYTKVLPFERLDGINEKLFRRIVDVNIKGVFLCSREAVPLMERSESPLIINISSTSGMDGRGSNIIYCAAKAAVNTLTRSLAMTLGPRIRVNAIAPGFIRTDFIKDLPKKALQKEWSRAPLRRAGLPEDVAKTATALWESLRFMTGQVLVVDGGRTLSSGS